MNGGLRRTLLMLAVGLSCLVAIVAGTRAAMLSSADLALTAHARLLAGELARRTARDLASLDAGSGSAALGAGARDHLLELAEEGPVSRLRVFDAAGVPVVDSGPGWAPTADAAADRLVQQVLRTGDPAGEAGTADPDEGGGPFARAYHPLERAGGVAGVIELQLDGTPAAEAVLAEVERRALRVSVILAVALLVPGLVLVRSVGHTHAALAQLSRASRHDQMTGLPNRVAFRADVDVMAEETDPEAGFRVLLIDLDRFKDVNDTRGHAFGDLILKEVAARLAAEAGGRATVYRLDGDEFALLQPLPLGPGTSRSISRRMIGRIAKPMTVNAACVRLTASAGVADWPRDGEAASDLLRAANFALHEAKRRGGARPCRYEPEMERARTERLAIEARLRNAVESGDFELHFQPLIRVNDHSLLGYEALLRLADADGTPIPPSVFIPIAEENELIVELGDLVLRRAAEAAVGWDREDLSVAVNLSPVQFRTGDLPERVRRVLAETGLPGHRLELEVTETVLMAQPDAVAIQLDALKESGVSLALDDFGTGFSSLSSLWKLPFDRLKIDRSFVNGLNSGNARTRQIIETIVALGECLELSITAEGIETIDQARQVSQMRIHAAQGYYYGRPAPEPLHCRGGLSSTA